MKRDLEGETVSPGGTLENTPASSSPGRGGYAPTSKGGLLTLTSIYSRTH